MRSVLAVGIVAPVASLALAAQSTPPAPTRSVREGVYTTVQAQRGEPLYATHCARCHGADLEGRSDFPVPPPWPRGIVGIPPKPGSPPLKGPRFDFNWNNLPLGRLFERQRISMPQDAPGSLTRQRNADILAFILETNGYAPGEGELPGNDKAALNDIRVEPLR